MYTCTFILHFICMNRLSSLLPALALAGCVSGQPAAPATSTASAASVAASTDTAPYPVRRLFLRESNGDESTIKIGSLPEAYLATNGDAPTQTARMEMLRWTVCTNAAALTDLLHVKTDAMGALALDLGMISWREALDKVAKGNAEALPSLVRSPAYQLHLAKAQECMVVDNPSKAQK